MLCLDAHLYQWDEGGWVPLYCEIIVRKNVLGGKQLWANNLKPFTVWKNEVGL